MADEDSIFDNLPRGRRRLDADDNSRSHFRELMGFYVPEGPLPERPRPSGKGGPSLGVSNAPPAVSASPTVTGTPAVGQTLSCDNGVWFHSPTSYAYQWKRDGVVISGATSSTYVVVAADLGHSLTCTVTATNAFGSAPATSNAVLIVAIPVNTTAPVVSGTATVGSTLTCTTGVWTNSPTSYAYQWLQNGVNISGATASTYVVVTGDAGTSIRCTVTASNATASGSATSNALAIAALPSAPSNTVAPVVSGTATVGSTLSCTTGTWSNSPTSYAYQWQRNGVDTSGATASTYLTVTADGGTSVSCRVAATNAGGTTSIASNALAIAAGGATSVWSAADAAANGMALSNGGLTVTNPNAAVGWYSVRGTVSHTSGKFYAEFLCLYSNTNDGRGVASSEFVSTNPLGASNYSGGQVYGNNNVSSGFTSNYTTTQVASAGVVVGLAVDFGSGGVWLAFDNVWVNSSNPATGSLPIMSFVPATVGGLFPALSLRQTNDSYTLQPTPASQKYLPPAGYQAWDGGPITPSTSVWSAADAAANGMTLSNGGLTVTPPSSIGAFGVPIRSSISKTSGKLYVEFAVDASITDGQPTIGFGDAGMNMGAYLGFSNYSAGVEYGTTTVSAGFTSNYTISSVPNPNDVWALAVDFAAGSIWIAKNNVWFNSSSPSTGSLPIISFVPATVGALFAAMSFAPATHNGVWTLQPTAASQKYAPPAGFSAWG